MNHVTTEIEGLDFEHSCVGLARQLERRAGIQRVDVDERTNRVVITYDDTRLSARDFGASSPNPVATCTTRPLGTTRTTMQPRAVTSPDD